MFEHTSLRVKNALKNVNDCQDNLNPRSKHGMNCILVAQLVAARLCMK